ncbi:GNAT family N-acetyltransferase [Sphingobacterium rhinopitheci]|mgnify:CR=1 FL=1|uniref:GNAT family N-acetyltransferase n=1 Tax=Sphingobacterium rhinopitheci TaxID=2781960 RepID=UPI001F51DB31|nr:GNAT family N-acetyltransferase [Sphingobacterium rhinopitheci]MCI0920420.1 N-acetyltransferase [Sphingobacterium rhinopitheci]
MKEEFQSIDLVKNNHAQRFELSVDGYTAFIDYREHHTIISLIHTESPEQLAGRGVATALIEKTLQYLDSNKLVLIPLCPLVFAYIKRHLVWLRIVHEDYKDRFMS